jgi:hypothetical protein
MLDPFFTNVTDLGAVDSSQNVFGLLANLTGSDPDSHYPLTFDVSNGSTLPGTIDISNTSDGSGVGVFHRKCSSCIQCFYYL